MNAGKPVDGVIVLYLARAIVLKKMEIKWFVSSSSHLSFLLSPLFPLSFSLLLPSLSLSREGTEYVNWYQGATEGTLCTATKAIFNDVFDLKRT